MTAHNWVPSTLGHGETMCNRCWITNREAAVLGEMNHCPVPEPTPAAPQPANENKPWTQEAIDNDISEVDDGDDEEEDRNADCGRWDNGALAFQCRLAGTEWCDWDCPVGLPIRSAAT